MSRSKFIYLPRMICIMALLKYWYDRLPSDGEGVTLPCEVSFPCGNKFPNVVSPMTPGFSTEYFF